MALVAQGAAEIVRDSEAVERGMKEAVALALDEERLEMLAANIAKLAVSDSAERVVKVIDEELNRA